MKHPSAYLLLLLTLTGCSTTTQIGSTTKNENLPLLQNGNSASAVSNVNVNANTNTKIENKNTNTATPLQASLSTKETSVYHGSWFSIKYPKNFVPSPLTSTDVQKDELPTDEVRFTSPDKSVEFFVYSPQWNGDPKEYLKVASNEELVSEKSENGGKDLEKFITKWATIKAKDGSYTRSYVSMKNQVDTGSDVHHVFGIKYKDAASYELHKDAYIAFKASLEQFAD